VKPSEELVPFGTRVGVIALRFSPSAILLGNGKLIDLVLVAFFLLLLT